MENFKKTTVKSFKETESGYTADFIINYNGEGQIQDITATQMRAENGKWFGDLRNFTQADLTALVALINKAITSAAEEA